MQVAREDLVCSMRDKKLGAKDDFSRGIALDSQGTALQNLKRAVVTGSAGSADKTSMLNQIWGPS